MRTHVTGQEKSVAWMGQRVEFPGGWAGDLAWSDGALWVAWASCADPEPEMLSAVNRDWPLRPGVTLEEWRRRSAGTVFTVSLALLGEDGPAEMRELDRSQHSGDGPVLAALPGQATPTVLWVSRRGSECVLMATVGGERDEVVARSAGAILNPRAAGEPNGRLWAVWQQWPGPGTAGGVGPRVVGATRDLGTPPGARGAWSSPAAISPGRQSAWAPAVAAGPDGALWCAWDAWDGTTYQVFARHAPPGGDWGPVAQVSEPHPAIRYLNLAPDLAASTERAWLVWGRSTPWGEMNHRFNHIRSLHAGLVSAARDGTLSTEPASGRLVQAEPGRLPVPAIPFFDGDDPQFINPQAPRMRLSPDGHPVVFFRQFRRDLGGRDFGWVTCAMLHTGEEWTAPMRLAEQAGFPDTPYGVVSAGPDSSAWVLAAHAGDRPVDKPTQSPVSNHRLVVEGVSLGKGVLDEQVGLHYTATAPLTHLPTRKREVLSGEPVRDMAVEGQTYNLLFGDLHRHSIYSKCMSANDGDPLDHWRWANDVEELDFYAITEHLEYMSYVEWRRVDDLAEVLASSDRVLALGGFELAIPPGHTNFFYADQTVGQDLRVACLSSMDQDLKAVWPKLDDWIPAGKVVAIRHYHTGTHQSGDVVDTYDPAYESVVEIIQTRGEFPQWVQSLWRKGLRVGVIGSSDHSRNAPFLKALTGLWLPQGVRSREAVLEALRARRTFATNGPKISVLLSATGDDEGPVLVMGEEGKIKGSPRLMVEVAGTRSLETVEFYRDDRLLHVETVGKLTAKLEHVDGAAPPGEHVYWVRVIQGPEREGMRPLRGVAYSSPVWLTV